MPISEVNRYGLTADATLQNTAGYWPENQAPSTVNNAAREMMGDIRRWQQQINAEITATYAAGAYTLTLERSLTAGELGGVFTFIADAANSASATLNINATGAKEMRRAEGPLPLSAIDAKQIVTVAYDPAGDVYQVLNPVQRLIAGLPNTTESTASDSVALYVKADDVNNQISIGNLINRATLHTSGGGSGRAVSFASIPSWVTQITMTLAGVSTNGGNDSMLVQLGSGSYETSGYSGSASNAGGGTQEAYSAGFLLDVNPANANVWHGQIVITNVDGNTWAATHVIALSNTTGVNYGGGSKTLSGALDSIRLQLEGSTDSFDAGTVNVRYA